MENEIQINGKEFDWNDIKVVLCGREIKPIRSTVFHSQERSAKFAPVRYKINLILSDDEIESIKLMAPFQVLVEDDDAQWEYYYRRGNNCFFRYKDRKFQLELAQNPQIMKLLVWKRKYSIEIK